MTFTDFPFFKHFHDTTRKNIVMYKLEALRFSSQHGAIEGCFFKRSALFVQPLFRAVKQHEQRAVSAESDDAVRIQTFLTLMSCALVQTPRWESNTILLPELNGQYKIGAHSIPTALAALFPFSAA